MKTTAVVATDHVEHRARILPWGIELQIWHLVETRTLPTVAAHLPIATLFDEGEAGAIPSAVTDDETTLENPITDTTVETDVEFEYLGADDRVGGAK